MSTDKLRRHRQRRHCQEAQERKFTVLFVNKIFIMNICGLILLHLGFPGRGEF